MTNIDLAKTMKGSTTAETILVVDDNLAVCELIEVILCSAGYHVLTAGNGIEALRLARHTPQIDLLVSDIEMPGMRGDELAGHFAALHPMVPVLFVSSTTGPIAAPRTYGFLAKPFTVPELRESVRRALRMRPEMLETAHVA